MSLLKKSYLVLFFLVFILTSCFERTLDKKAMWEKGLAYDPNIQLVLPDKDHPAVDCNYYGPGCLNGYYVKIRGIIMHFIRFENEETARRAATRFNAFYRYNWVFEDIQTEPVLQDFVQSVYGAKRPPPPIKAKPKKKEEFKKIEVDFDGET